MTTTSGVILRVCALQMCVNSWEKDWEDASPVWQDSEEEEKPSLCGRICALFKLCVARRGFVSFVHYSVLELSD